MSDLSARLNQLGPAQRALLERTLARRRLDLPAVPVRVEGQVADGTRPTSFAQQRLWFLQQLDPEGVLYNTFLGVQLAGSLDSDLLERTLRRIEARHEVLRLRFETRDGRPYQTPRPGGELVLPVVDLRALGVAAEDEAQRRALAEIRRPFDLTQGPLWRGLLMRLDDEHHWLVLTLHHAVSDRWSIDVLMFELASLYAALHEGRDDPLPPLPAQYADFARWQRDLLTTEHLARQMAYWRDKLAPAPARLELPADRRGGPTATAGAAGRCSVKLSDALLEELALLGRMHGATLFMTLLTGFVALLARYCGQHDIAVGTPIVNRSRAEFEGLIGCFTNTLVLRTDLSGDPSFEQALRRARQTCLDAYAHQDVPFERVVEDLQPDRDSGPNAFFQVLFVLNDRHDPLKGRQTLDFALRRQAISIAPLDLDSGAVQAELVLHVEKRSGASTAVLEYDGARFDRARMQRLLAHYATLLMAAAQAPGTPLARLELLSEDERRELLERFNATQRPYPRDRPLAWLFETSARRHGHRPALTFPGEAERTYAELADEVTRLAQVLRAHGVQRGARVGLLLERSAALVSAMLGTVTAGGAYLPLDPAHPRERLLAMLSDAHVGAVVTTRALARDLPAGAWPVLLLDELRLTDWPASALTIETGPDDLAYVIYTSGSTGHPKGVAVSQRAVARLVLDSDYMVLGPDDVVAQASNASFDAATFEIWGALLNGARLVGIPRDTALSPQDLSAYLSQHEITTLFLTTALFNQMSAATPGCFAGLTHLLFGGEAVDVESVRRVLAQGAPRRLLHVYGPTETTTFATWQLVESLAPDADTVPIGKPLANSSAYVLDPEGQLLPIGVPGELFLGGDGLARGYLDDPLATARQFVPDPCSRDAGARLYRTGDRARWRSDGTLEFLGRFDHQVKIRGFRIEPAEIEACLLQHPDIAQAVVLAREQRPGERRLVAYVALTANAAGLAGARQHLATRLPDYMMPSAFVVLDALPVNANGKIDRRALPAPAATSVEAPDDIGYVPPATPLEELIAGLWCQVLGVPRVGLHDSFFELGGHSLLATQLVAQIHASLGLRLPLRALFEAPTVAGVCAALDTRADRPETASDGALPELVARPAEAHEPFALTDVQEAYWIGRTETFDLGGVSAYGYVEIDVANLDVARLEDVARRLVARHPMLRAVVQPDGRQQVLAETPPFQIICADLTGLDPEQREQALLATRARLEQQVLPAARWPLFELQASRLARDLVRLHIGTDALISDAWSWQILAREAALLYADPNTQLAPIECSFRDYVGALEVLARTTLFERAWRYWRARLLDLPPAPQLPILPRRMAGGRQLFKRRSLRLAATDWARLKERGLHAGLTPSVLVLTAFAETLATWSKEPRFTVNLTLFNRLPLHPHVQRVVGDFTSLVLLGLERTARATFAAFARDVQARLWEALDQRYVSGVKVLRELAIGAGRERAAMPVVFTSLLNLDSVSLPASGGLLGRLAYSVSQTPQVWLDHQVHEERGALVCTWDCVDDLFPAGLPQAMFEGFERLLRHLCRGEVQLEARAPSLLPEAQRVQRTEINATGAPLATESLHTLGLAWLERAPEAPAVITTGMTLSYSELHARAASVAGWLRQAGVRRAELVALVMEKGWEQIVAVLGVLQAGAAYLPIDPELPSERMRYLLADTGARLVLTQASIDTRLDWPAGLERVVVSSLAPEAVPRASAPGSAADLAYVIYTSGSTGRPKGVMIDHRGAVNTIVDINRRFGLNARDRVLGLSSLSFDLSVWDVFGTLAAGGALVLPDAHLRRDPVHWTELLARHAVSVWNSVPALMTVLVEHLSAGAQHVPDSLRLVLLSGDWIPVTLPARLRALSDATCLRIVSLGGATEASIWSIYHDIEALSADWTSIPYGRPLTNQSFHVLDAAREPRPMHVPGELYIGGVGLALGYWADPQRSAEKFVPHPDTGERLYRTGDLGRYLPDGSIEFLGREDFQVKVQGYRIELGEIEAALGELPGVRDALVLAREDQPGDRRLVAYVVSDPDTTLDEGVLRAALAARLPAYMLPAHYLFLPHLPLTANGKVDRQALPAPERPGPGEHATRARDTREELLAGIFADVLGLEQVGLEDDFFALGGHSMLATRAISKVRETFGVELPLRRLFEHPSVRALAVVLEAERLAGGAAHAAPALTAVGRPERVPLSFAQQRLWLLDQLTPGSSAYAMPAAVRLHGVLDVAALGAALDALVARQEALRTVFPSDDGRPRQQVLPARGLPLAQDDLAHLPADSALVEAMRLAQGLTQAAFDLARGPLVRARLMRLAEHEHLLVLVMHHIVSDGWSLGVLVHELAALYEAQRTATAAALPALPVQYADFALWQRGWLSGAALEAQLDYWRGALSGAPEVLSLPTDRPRPRVQRFRGAHVDLEFDATLSNAARALARERHVTLFMVLLATFQTLLHRISGEDDVLVGTPVANRTRAQVEHLVGFFANTLVLRARFEDDPSFEKLLLRTRESALLAQAHQDLPFERLVEELRPRRRLDHTPLFQVMFVLQNAPLEPLELPGLTLAPQQAETGGTHFDLTLRAWEHGARIVARLEYDTDLFERASIERLGRQLVGLLGACLRAPERRLGSLALLDAEQPAADLEVGTASEPPIALDARLAALVRAHPDAPALSWGTATRDRATLAHEVAALAGTLRALGAGPEARVAVLLERAPELATTLLACHAAGAAFVPLDPRHPRERTLALLHEAQCRLLVTRRPRLAEFGGVELPACLCLDELQAPAQDVLDAGPVNEQCLAYVIHTSGSTGRPKGALLTRAALALYVDRLAARLGIDEHDVYLHTASFSFSSSVRQLFLPLAVGAHVVLATAEDVADPLRLFALARRSGATVLDLVPSHWQQCVDSLAALPDGPRAALLDNRVRLLLSASEPLPGRLAHELRGLFGPRARLVNMCGQTETTGIVCTHAVQAEDERVAVVPVGQPLAGTWVRLLDRYGHAVAPGQIGEICVGGATLARGYSGTASTSAQAFIPDIQSARPGARLYRTGDLGRWRADGALEFLGRRDQQVKVRGYRVELAEVETAVMAHPDVARAALGVQADAGGYQGLTAWVVARAGSAPTATALRAFLETLLPEYMLPARFLLVTELPLTSTGKLDRRALARVEARVLESAQPFVAPSTPLEEVVAGIWSTVLGREGLSVHDDFFALGGHSLLATQVIARLREACALELPLRTLFEAPTIASLAEAVQAERASARRGAALPALERVARADVLPLSCSQERLWLIDRLAPGSVAYVVPAVVRLQGALDPAALQRAFDLVLARHEVLRTRFPVVDGRPHQEVLPPAGLEVVVDNLSGLAEPARQAALDELLRTVFGQPFDLATGPLVRVRLARLQATEHVLLLALHHIVSDGWSIGLWVRELAEAYEAARSGRAARLPLLPVQYADFAVWQRAGLETAHLKQQFDYWRARLLPPPALLDLPSDHARPQRPSGRGAHLTLAFGRTLSATVKTCARAHGCSDFMVLLAALQALLQRTCDETDVCVGTPVAGRSRRELEPLLGCFVNTLVLRTRVRPEASFRELLREVRATTLAAFEHQDVPFERLVEELQPRRELGVNSLFQVMFVLQNAPTGGVDLGPLTLSQVPFESHSAKFDLTLALGETPGGLVATLEYATDIFERASAERLLYQYRALLADLLEAPERPLQAHALALAGAVDLPTAMRTPAPGGYDPEASVPALFALQARRRGAACALEQGARRVSYAQLDAASARLAMVLRAHGVGRGTRVAVCLGRSPELVVTLLAVLRVGGAYVPLDPEYPAQRLSFMLRDSGATLLLAPRVLAERFDAPARLDVEDLEIDNLLDDAHAGPPLAGDARVNGLDLAYVMYTSGSTGLPKGIAIPQRGVTRLAAGAPAFSGVTEDDVFLFHSSPSFDATTFEIWGALLNGARLVLPASARPTLAELADTLATHSVSVLWLTAGLFHLAAAERPEALAGLRCLLAGGEALSAAHVQRVRAHAPGLRIVNGYGPTENTTFSCCHEVAANAAATGRVPIGSPLPASSAYVLDAEARALPPGVVGELHVGGDGLAHGYLGRPDATAATFVPDPFSEQPGARLYRTGDRVRRRADGTLDFLGRLDGQIKLRGFRVELGEIEGALASVSDVVAAGVDLRAAAGREPRLVAYVVPARPEWCDVGHLRAELARRLPGYMLPSQFVFVERLPLTPNGKLDRRALPEPEDPRPEPGTPRREPTTDTERALAELWSALLARPSIAADDDFFALGGHSLLATQLAARIEVRFGVRLSLAAVFTAPTLTDLARQVELLCWARAAGAPLTDAADDEIEL